METLHSTLSAEEASEVAWDVIVIGAGIAGSVATIELARLGHRVLLVERSRMPRRKVCGACLNLDAIAGLRHSGAWQKIRKLGGHSIRHFDLRSGESRAYLPLPGGHAVSRDRMDQALVETAIENGADYLDQTAIRLAPHDDSEPDRRAIDRDGRNYRASTVVVATGLASTGEAADPKTARWQNQVDIHRHSRIGLGALLQGDPFEQSSQLKPGVISMNVGNAGYVGMVVTEQGTINLAAAMDREFVRDRGPAEACAAVLAACGWNGFDALATSSFLGTSTMTRQRKVAGDHRLFYVGDSSGYVEPFTGEGMSWAIRSGRAVAPLVSRSIEQWQDSLPLDWTRELKRQLGTQRRRCRLITRCLRHPALVRQGIRTLVHFPRLAKLAVNHVQREHPVV